MIAADKLLAKLEGVRQSGSGKWRARCPAHGGKSLSLAVADSDGRVLLKCFSGCETAAILSARGLTMSDLFDQPLGEPVPMRSRPVPIAPLEWSATAEQIWRRTVELRGTLGEMYLLSRNCMVPPGDSDLRYLPPNGKYGPTLCGRVTDTKTNKPISLHFTRLAADGRGKAGTGCDKLLLKGHRKAGGVVRLWPDECVQYSLGIAEGIETALSLAHGHSPVWAAIDANNLAQFSVLDGIESLVIGTDADSAGIDAAARCAERWGAAGKNVLLVAPSTNGCDLNDTVAA